MTTQKIILGYLEFLETKNEELIMLKSLDSDYDKLRIFGSLLEDYDTLIDQSSIAIKSLQVDNYNLDEHIAILKVENTKLKEKIDQIETFRMSTSNYLSESKQKLYQDVDFKSSNRANELGENRIESPSHTNQREGRQEYNQYQDQPKQSNYKGKLTIITFRNQT